MGDFNYIDDDEFTYDFQDPPSIGSCLPSVFDRLRAVRDGERHPPPSWQPPFESPAERGFAWHLLKYLSEDAELLQQHVVTTICGRFRIDFVVLTPAGRRIGLEVDGRDFHDFERDEWRDAMILGEGHCDVIYRLRARDLYRRITDVLYLVAQCDPAMFSVRGRINLGVLSSETVREIEADDYATHMKGVSEDWGGDYRGMLVLWRRHSCQLHPWSRQPWQQLFAFAARRGGGNLDEMIGQYRREMGDDVGTEL